LKERLTKAGILYGDIIEGKADDSDDLYEENQGARINEFEITDKVANVLEKPVLKSDLWRNRVNTSP
jgi:hypothetical protein